MEKKERNKLLLVAIIAALVLFVGLMAFRTIYITINAERDLKSIFGDGVITDEAMSYFIKERNKETFIITGIGLLILAIPTSLTVIGEKKNKRKMILAAGIVYIFTLVGIPSAILCFIAHAKMKKPETN